VFSYPLGLLLDNIIEHSGTKMKRSDIKSLINFHGNTQIDDLETSRYSEEDIKETLVDIDLEIHLSTLECKLIKNCLNLSIWKVENLMVPYSKTVSLKWDDKLDVNVLK